MQKKKEKFFKNEKEQEGGKELRASKISSEG